MATGSSSNGINGWQKYAIGALIGLTLSMVGMWGAFMKDAASRDYVDQKASQVEASARYDRERIETRVDAQLRDISAKLDRLIEQGH